MAIEPLGTGRLFYAGGYYGGWDDGVHLVDWINADNPLYCPTDSASYASYKTDDSDFNSHNDSIAATVLNRDTSKAGNEKIKAVVFPNPSQNIFTIYIAKAEETIYFDLQILNIDGSIIYNSFANTSDKVVWDASKVNSGIYYYKIRTNNGDAVSGKMVKI